MGFWDIASLALRGGKAVLSTTADVAKAGARVVSNNRGAISTVTAAAVSVTGKTVKVVGTAAKHGANVGAKAAYDAARRSQGPLGKLAGNVIGVAADTVAAAGRGVEIAGGVVDKSSQPVGDAVGGLADGATAAVSEALDAVAISKSDIDQLRAELAGYGESMLASSNTRRDAIDKAISRRRKGELLDLYVVGGVTLASMVDSPDKVPANVEAAFEMAYPDLAVHESFAEAVDRMSVEEIPGLVSGVKGKLFEMELVEQLNAEVLPDGYEASLAGSATQPGWDIQILGPDGSVAEVLQAKATESADYVKSALENYPNIDSITTSEVYAQLSAMGLAERVRDGGISEAALESMVTNAAGSGGGIDAIDMLPSVLGMAVIGMSVFMDKSLSASERAGIFGERSGRAGTASLVGKAAMIATQTWWIGLIGGVGSHWLAAKGRGKREHLEALREMLKALRKVDRRQRNLVHNPA